MDNTIKNVPVFISCDGDGIGQKVARAELSDDPALLKEISSKIVAGNDAITDFIVKNAGEVFSAGGDEVSGKIKVDAVEDLEALRTDYNYITGATLSIGVGQSLSQASKALMVAKVSGKNQTLQYTPEVEQKYQQASQQANAVTEDQKIGNAYMKNDAAQAPQEGQLAPESDVNSPNQDVSADDHSDCPYCAEADAQADLGEDDCPYCAEDDQVEQEAGLDDCPYCHEAHAEDQHQHGDDCAHCKEYDQKNAVGGEQPPQEDAPSAAPDAAAPIAGPAQTEEVPADGKPVELESSEHQTPDAVLEEFNDAHLDDPKEDPSQEGQSKVDQVGDVGIAEGNTNQEQNVSRPGDFNGEIPMGSADPMNTAGQAAPQQEQASQDADPNYGQVLQEGLNSNEDDIKREKVGDEVRQALQLYKAAKNSLEMIKDQDPQFYQANILMLRAMISMAKHMGFGGSLQSDGQAQGELGQEQQQMVEAQPQPEAVPGQTDWSNPFPTHPENGGDAGKTQGQ